VTRQGIDPRLLEWLPSATALKELCERKLRAYDTSTPSKTQRAHTASAYNYSKIMALRHIISSI
jgi:hypothetical protein